MLPVDDFENTVRDPEDAEKLLQALKDSSSGDNAAFTKLEAGYQRLWSLSTMRGFEETRIRLFRLVFCSFEPLSLSTLTHALCIRIDDTGLYNDRLTKENVKRLYSNFLIEDYFGGLIFAHDSAREFVSRMKPKEGVQDEYEFPEKKNHLSAAKLYIEVLKQLKHPIWQQLGLDPSDW